jgi:hypothetical protein
MTCLPSFPDEALCSHSDLIAIVGSLQAFQAFSNSVAYSAHEGMLFNFQRTWANSYPRTVRAELNIYGLISYRTIITADGARQLHYVINEGHAFALLYSFIQSVELLFRRTQYSGLVDVRLGLACKPRSTVLSSISGSNPEPIEESFMTQERVMAHNISTPDLKERIYRQFLWSCGYGPESLTTEAVKQLVNQFDRDPNYGGRGIS